IAASTVRLVDSRTFFAPLITRETVPTPTPDAAATSAMVTRPEGDISDSPVPDPSLEPVPCDDIHSVLRSGQDLGHSRAQLLSKTRPDRLAHDGQVRHKM